MVPSSFSRTNRERHQNGRDQRQLQRHRARHLSVDAVEGLIVAETDFGGGVSLFLRVAGQQGIVQISLMNAGEILPHGRAKRHVAIYPTRRLRFLVRL